MQSTLDLQQFVAVAGDASGAITLWNPAAEYMFGFTEREALGQSLDIIIPERLRQRHWMGYHKTMQSGQTRYGHDVLLTTADNKVTGIASIIRDESAKFNEDRALRKRLAELEAQVAEK